MRRISPIHGLTFFFLIGLILLTLIFKGHIPLWHSLLLRYLMLMALLFVLKIYSDREGKKGAFLSDFSPLVFVILIYESLGDLIQYLQPDIDSWLIQIDLFLFGVHPTLWMERWIVPWFTDFMSLAYLSYYFLPVTLIVVLYLKNRRMEFNESIFVFKICDCIFNPLNCSFNFIISFTLDSISLYCSIRRLKPDSTSLTSIFLFSTVS